ncbi:ABC transporter substrate-binding protein [Paenibacillus sp. FJAT-27812]|uniref:ABC transporter substrate-binding protein n=1 Tax=Paenibacillus sp. FJAT-27812 TaxID=1684143 RepID=UPI0006A77839|nr:AraC family transcriptional regulator [Paenibacillus sp. FJAT-27812]
MSEPIHSSLPLRSLVFHFEDMKLHSHSAGSVLAEQITSGYMLLIFKSGSGRLFTDNHSSLFSSYSSFLLPPKTAYQFESLDDNTLEYHTISFHVFCLEKGKPAPYGKPLFPNNPMLRVYPLAQWIDLLGQLHAGNTNFDNIEAFRQQLHFQKLIGFLLEHNLQTDHKAGSTQTVEQTIQYMQNHFQDNITVKQLVQMADVPSWQFTSIFKELTGKKPLDYLTELRINRSKEWLIHTDSPLRDIAERVGFTDEYYFSRRFRLMTGFSPRQYAISMRQNMLVKDWDGHEVSIPAQPNRILYCGDSVGDLKTLGIELVGSQMMHRDVPFNPEEAASLEPDLIICDQSNEKLYAEISQIAPTLTYNSRGTLEDRLLMLGEWLGKKKEAQQWLLHHNNNALLMWQQLQTLLRPKETASVFVYHRGKRLFVMGNIGLSSVLYHPDGFRPAGKVQDVLKSGRLYKEITEKTLNQYAGDRVFMMLPKSPDSRAAMEELIRSPIWRSLPAVKNGYSYVLDELDWNQEDASSRDKLLSLLPELLNQTS